MSVANARFLSLKPPNYESIIILPLARDGVPKTRIEPSQAIGALQAQRLTKCSTLKCLNLRVLPGNIRLC